MSNHDDYTVTARVAEAFDRLGIAYYIGGSVASSVHGVGRSTMDIDLVARVLPEHVHPLVKALERDFYVDATMIKEAIRDRTSFNVIHFELQHKVDVFIDKQRPYDRAAWERIQLAAPFDASEHQFPLASPEDVILAKLEWFMLSPSERQWLDVRGVMKVQASDLDLPYLRRWAIELNVSDLLERALREAGLV